MFSIDLNSVGTDPNGSGNWPPNQDFTAKANDTAPEPSEAMLVLTGGVFLAGVVRCRRKSVVSRKNFHAI